MSEVKFSIYSHILDHDEITMKIENNIAIELEENERRDFKTLKYDREKIENFIISFDGIQFENEKETKKKIMNFIDKFTEEKLSRTYNKKYTNKNNIEKIYTYERLGTLNNSLISIHLNTDNPHLHLVFDKKETDKSFGKYYSVLQKSINKIANDLGLVTTLNREINKEKDFELDKLQKDLKKFSWALKNNKELKGRTFGQVKLKNVCIKLNEFIEKKGSYTFAEKIKKDLEDKGYFYEIKLKDTQEHKYISRKINDNNYRKVAEKVFQDCKLSKPLNKEIRNFLRTESKNEMESNLKDAILDMYKSSNYKFSEDAFTKIYDMEKTEKIFKNIEREIEQFEIEKYFEIKETKLISEIEIRKEIRGINLSYEDFENRVGKSISYICFENNNEYMKDNSQARDWHELKREIKNLNEDLSDNFIDSIAGNILEDYRDRYEIIRKEEIQKEIELADKLEKEIEEKIKKEEEKIKKEEEKILEAREKLERSLEAVNELLKENEIDRELDKMSQYVENPEENLDLFENFEKDKIKTDEFEEEIESLDIEEEIDYDYDMDDDFDL